MPGRLANLISGEYFINFMNAGYKNQGSNIPVSYTHLPAVARVSPHNDSNFRRVSTLFVKKYSVSASSIQAALHAGNQREYRRSTDGLLLDKQRADTPEV